MRTRGGAPREVMHARRARATHAGAIFRRGNAARRTTSSTSNRRKDLSLLSSHLHVFSICTVPSPGAYSTENYEAVVYCSGADAMSVILLSHHPSTHCNSLCKPLGRAMSCHITSKAPSVHASISHRSSRAEPTSSSGSPSRQTRARSPSWQSRQRRSRGRRCGRRPVCKSCQRLTFRHGFRTRAKLTMAKSPRIVPGWEARGLVAPSSMRPVLTTSRPSHTMAQTGPLAMSVSGSVRVNFSQALAIRTCDETLKEWLVAQVGVVLLKVLLGWRHELDGGEFEAVFDQQPIITWSSV